MQLGRRKRGRSDSYSPAVPPYSPPIAEVARNTSRSDNDADGRGGSILFAPTGLIHYGGGRRLQANQHTPTLLVFLQKKLLHMQALQDVLRRTSLAEMRDRDVVAWLLGAENWLRALNRPFAEGNDTGDDREGFTLPSRGLPSDTSTDMLCHAYRSALSELRLLVLGVLHTMPWWRVVETVAHPIPPTASHSSDASAELRSSKEDGGGAEHRAQATRRSSAANRAGQPVGGGSGFDRALAARHAITRWHVRLQIAFERVCLLLIGQSQHTVRGVLEVLLKPCQLRPPVRDGARRSIPSDSFIRVLNAVATEYGAPYVVSLLEDCLSDFMPRRRWAERRHHVACTAVLLYLALEGHTPAYHPHLGNSQSLQRALELLKSLRWRVSNHYGEADPSLGLQPHPHRYASSPSSTSLRLPSGTSEESGTDMRGKGESLWPSLATSGGHASSFSMGMPESGDVLPGGYVSSTLMEVARSGGGVALHQPALPRPSCSNGGPGHLQVDASASDTEISDSGNKASERGTRQKRERVGDSGKVSDSSAADVLDRGEVVQQSKSCEGGGAPGATKNVDHGGAAAANPPFLEASVVHNNKLLSCRNEIIRVLLSRLLDMEQTLEPREAAAEEWQEGEWGRFSRVSSPRGPPSVMVFASQQTSVQNSPFGSSTASRLGSPAALHHSQITSVAKRGQATEMHDSAPVSANAAPVLLPDPTNPFSPSSSAASSPLALMLPRSTSPAAYGGAAAGSGSRWVSCSSPRSTAGQPVEAAFNALSQPYLRILRDCTTLVYGRLADDLQRQQVAGSCGNADWWQDLVFFHLTAVMRVDRPVYLLYLAPSLSMLGAEDESVGLVHKVITLVTKGTMPVEQPRASSVVGGGGASGRFSSPWPSSSNGEARKGGLGVVPSLAAPVQPVRMRMAPPAGASRRLVTMEERLRAARHIFPLFRFLQSRIDAAAGEGVRRRLLKWTAHEWRRLSGRLSLTRSGGEGGGFHPWSQLPPSREARLALIVFAQCAAISEAMGVEVLLRSNSDGSNTACSTGAGKEKTQRGGSRFTSTSASGDTSDGIALILAPLLDRYTSQTTPPAEENDSGSGVSEESNQSATSTHYFAETRFDAADGPSSPDAAVGECPLPALPHNSAADGAHTGSSPSASACYEGHAEDASLPRLPSHRQRRRVDLAQMEMEGLLQFQLMAHCPWEAWLH